MEDIVSEIGKGFLRGIGYLLVEVLFNFVFYYIGWPICKILSLGTYPKKVTHDYLHTDTRQGAVAGAECNTAIELKPAHYAAAPSPLL